MIEILPILIKALLITLVVELLMLFLLKERKIKIFIVCGIINIITNPILNIILQYTNHYYLLLIILEIVIVIIEGIIYYLFKKDIKKAFMISLICNLASLLMGMII